MNAIDAISTFWKAARERDWTAFGAVLAADVVYELPQTRERVRGREAYVRFNAEYPGDWDLTPMRIVGADRHGASWIRFVVDGGEQTGIAFFDLDEAGLIARITDFWPTPYEPPPGREHLVGRR
jgi:ketosteroid isomerase-like protein